MICRRRSSRAGGEAAGVEQSHDNTKRKGRERSPAEVRRSARRGRVDRTAADARPVSRRPGQHGERRRRVREDRRRRQRRRRQSHSPCPLRENRSDPRFVGTVQEVCSDRYASGGDRSHRLGGATSPL